MKTLPKCLLVDDLADNLTALSSLLADEEVEIHTAQSGTEALALLLQNDYAVALVDVQMPQMDGFELAEIMRSTFKTKAIPIIFVTAADNDIKRMFKGYEAGAVDFLFKPLFPQVVVGKVRVFIDLYKQKKLLEETFRKANEELEIKVQERTRELMMAQQEMEAFSYSVSHDLRAPLRIMNGFSNTLLAMYSEQLDDRGKDYLNRIIESARKMGELIDGMLILSNLGQVERKKEIVNLSQISEEILDSFRKSEPNRNIKLHVSKDLIVEADPTLMFALMENLLENAWKYTSKKDLAEIDVGSEVMDNKRIYFVRDNGAGFNMKFVDKLFGAFQRLHAPADFTGMGIGLATAKRILDRHGGKIWAQGEVGKGATFYFHIP